MQIGKICDYEMGNFWQAKGHNIYKRKSRRLEMNIPNAISLFRIALVPLFTALYLKGHCAAAMAVLLLSGLSDILDGAIARRMNMVTDLGKVLDPVADKLIQTAMMLCALKVSAAVWWLLAAHLIRESVLSLLGLHVIRVSGRVNSARWYGKACTALIYTVMIAVLAFPSLPQKIVQGMVLFCAAAVGACLLLYAGGYMSCLKRARPN